MICNYCKKDPGLKKGSDVVWSGFRDQETGQHVCFGCQDLHYINKTKLSAVEGMCTYSELPVILPPPTQLRLKL